VRRAERAQHAPDPAAELCGRLAGEGEADDAVRLDKPVGHQPCDAQAHRLGLARAGTGDDDVRVQRRADGGRLLGGGRELLADVSGDLGGGQARARHVVTARPSSCTGQLVRTGQKVQ
jgi:hypothetical protein